MMGNPPQRKIKILIDATSITNDMTGVTRYGIEIFKVFKNYPNLKFSFIISPLLKKNHKLFELFDPAQHEFFPLNVKGIGPLRELKILLFRFSKKLDFDVFHCLTTNAPFAFPGKSVTTIHDLKYIKYPEYFGTHPRLKSLFLKLQILWALKTYSKIICVSQSTLNDLETFFPNQLQLIKRKGIVLHNGLTPIRPPLNYHSSLNIPTKFFLYIGELRPHKNIQNLIDAFLIFKKSDTTGAKLVIGGRMHPSFKLKFDNPDLIYLGPIEDEDLHELYLRSVCLVFPSLYEGFGLPILEAMELGVPVITSNISSMPEVSGDAALLVNPHSTFEIARSMERIINDSELNGHLIQKGKQQAQLFSWQENAESLIREYRKITLG